MFARVTEARPTLVFMPPHTPGERLRQLRKALGLSLRDVAKRAETISYSTVYGLETRPGSWENVELGTLRAVARALNQPLVRIVALASEGDDAPDLAARVLEEVGHLLAHPEWGMFPVYRSDAAENIKAAQPRGGLVAYIPKEHLIRSGAKLSNVYVFHLDGDCVVSDEARRSGRSFTSGDYVAVEVMKEPPIGEVVAVWWPKRKLLVLKRHGVDVSNVPVTRLDRPSESYVLPSVSDVEIMGRVVWRGG